jgi:hypothetical protein
MNESFASITKRRVIWLINAKIFTMKWYRC